MWRSLKVRVTGEDEVWECYEPNVLTHWMICLICLAYAPADDDRSREILGDRIVECVNGKLVLHKIERATPNTAYQNAQV
jgi:hypothetical protein